MRATHALRSTTPRAVRRCAPLSAGRASAAVSQKEQAPATPETQAALDLNPPRGTRDFYPEELRVRNWLFGQWRATAAAHGFEEYDSPVLESEALYVRKAGEEVTQQLYNFEDKGGRRVALRPEMTPSLARMVMARKNALPLPHYQWNMDIWGVPGVTAEAEVLAAVVGFFERVGIDSADVGIKINSREVLAELLARRRAAWTRPTARASRRRASSSTSSRRCPRPSSTTTSRRSTCRPDAVDALVEKLGEGGSIEALEALLGADSPALANLREVYALAEAYGYADWLVFDASVVRGLAYYTGVVFEAFDRSGELRAICGGGRYDKLLESFGGDALPAVGFGFGDAVVMELLEMKGLVPDLDSSVDAVLFALASGDGDNDAALARDAAGVASTLRKLGLRVDLVLEPKKPKWAFKHADRKNAPLALMLAPDEWANGRALVVKDLGTGDQANVPLDELPAWLEARA
ncbi:histidyl-trna synthetase [Aureococcus anophagefferens]|nr:histidyl-trna synthetase [Aureococcus anophagefferens]